MLLSEVLTLLSSRWFSTENDAFSDFKHSFSKVYDAGSEARRKTTFAANLQRIASMNEESSSRNWQAGVNTFTDLTAAEFAGLYLSSSVPLREPRSFARSPEPRSLSPNPRSLDWRAKGAVTPVKDQGTCGACWTFAATGVVEGAYEIATGALRPLSEQQLLDCVGSPQSPDDCSGGVTSDALKYIHRNGGIDSEVDYSYVTKQGTCWATGAQRYVAKADGVLIEIASDDEAQLLQQVAAGPVAVAVAVGPAFQHYTGGVLDDATACGAELNHGMLVVGYGDDAATGLPYYIVKNSWSSDWGEDGYIRMARGKNMCFIARQADAALALKGPPLPLPPRSPTVAPTRTPTMLPLPAINFVPTSVAYVWAHWRWAVAVLTILAGLALVFCGSLLVRPLLFLGLFIAVGAVAFYGWLALTSIDAIARLIASAGDTSSEVIRAGGALLAAIFAGSIAGIIGVLLLRFGIALFGFAVGAAVGVAIYQCAGYLVWAKTFAPVVWGAAFGTLAFTALYCALGKETVRKFVFSALAAAPGSLGVVWGASVLIALCTACCPFPTSNIDTSSSGSTLVYGGVFLALYVAGVAAQTAISCRRAKVEARRGRRSEREAESGHRRDERQQPLLLRRIN